MPVKRNLYRSSIIKIGEKCKNMLKNLRKQDDRVMAYAAEILKITSPSSISIFFSFLIRTIIIYLTIVNI